MLLGLTGTLGAGKGAVVEYLVTNKGFTHLSVSDFLAEEIKHRGLLVDRPAMRDMANEYRSKYSAGPVEVVYARVADRIEKGENIIIESEHTPIEVKFIQSKKGKVFSVDADLVVRYERISKRGSVKDSVSFEQFSAEQKREFSSEDATKNNLGGAIAVSDFHLTNNASLEELHAQIEEALKEFGI